MRKPASLKSTSLKSAGLLSVALLVAGASWSAGHAADPGYCQDYARRAVAQYQTNKSIPGCFHGVSRRWHGDYALHFGWCVTARPATARAEDAYREARVDACRSRAP